LSLSKKDGILERDLMRQVIKTISIGFFCSVYLAVSLAGLIGTMQLPAISPGPQTVTTGRPLPKEKPTIVWTQRRHTPAVKHFSLSPAIGIKEQYAKQNYHCTALPDLTHTSSFTVFHSSGVSPRAPPLV
jgi:hypothetical protein